MINRVGALNSQAVKSSFKKAAPKAKEQEQGVKDKVSLGRVSYSTRNKLKNYAHAAKLAVLGVGGMIAGGVGGALAGAAGGTVAGVTLGITGAVSGLIAGGIVGAQSAHGVESLSAALGYGLVGAAGGAVAGVATGLAAATAAPVVGAVTGAVTGGIAGIALSKVKLSMS